jgi:hypothetical protein
MNLLRNDTPAGARSGFAEANVDADARRPVDSGKRVNVPFQIAISLVGAR